MAKAAQNAGPGRRRAAAPIAARQPATVVHASQSCADPLASGIASNE